MSSRDMSSGISGYSSLESVNEIVKDHNQDRDAPHQAADYVAIDIASDVSAESSDFHKTAQNDSEQGACGEVTELPEKHGRVRRTASKPFFSPYRRLALVVALINVALLGVGIDSRWWFDLPALAYMVVGNIFVAIVIRQQRLINALFWVATRPSTRWPLPVRWMLGKIYHFGGLHSGCAVAATVWFLLFTASATYNLAAGRPGISVATVVVTYVVACLLVIIVVLALPKLRSRFHNTFEASHRFLGWTVLALVWAHAMLLINDSRKLTGQSFGHALVRSPTLYLLIVITLSIASPWMTLRRVRVKVTKPSNHVIIVQFEEGVSKPFAGSSTAVSLSPALEWHSFANVVAPQANKRGFRLVISRAGDWTSKVIDDPPSHFYIKGIATAGVARIETLFKRVLYIATGSGIGPVLPHLLAKRVPCHLFWSTRTPVDTYGQELVDEILQACPDAEIYDTVANGKPNMVLKSYELLQRFEAEAVIVISNQSLTRKVVYGMESRGIPAFGAIWDS